MKICSINSFTSITRLSKFPLDSIAPVVLYNQPTVHVWRVDSSSVSTSLLVFGSRCIFQLMGRNIFIVSYGRLIRKGREITDVRPEAGKYQTEANHAGCTRVSKGKRHRIATINAEVLLTFDRLDSEDENKNAVKYLFAYSRYKN